MNEIEANGIRDEHEIFGSTWDGSKVIIAEK